jgi:phage shock protein A
VWLRQNSTTQRGGRTNGKPAEEGPNLDSGQSARDGRFRAKGQLACSLRRKKADLDQGAAELDRNIDIFLREGKEDLALAAQSKLNSVNRLIQNYEEMVERQEIEFQNLKDARLKLEAKLTTVKQEREELQALLDLARSKELTAKTIKSLDDLMGAGDDDISRVAEGIRDRLDKASARSEMLSGSLEAQMDEVLETSTLESQLAERKARLGL